jgi:ABC-type transporter Mla subunit MlaD
LFGGWTLLGTPLGHDNAQSHLIMKKRLFSRIAISIAQRLTPFSKLSLILAIVGLAACGKPANTSLPAAGPAGDASQSDVTPESSISHQEETQVHGKYDDVKEMFNKIIDADMHLTAQLEKVNDAADLAADLNENASALEEFTATFKSLQAKYPEVFSQKNTPPELEETMKRFDSVMSTMDATYQAIDNAWQKFNSSPMVNQANDRFQAARQVFDHLNDPQ